ncbi:MAG: hypothetical protein IKI42_02025, partial [Clostridia bacterium]|nr:hypothetical protein [Clostridia bacterium]
MSTAVPAALMGLARSTAFSLVLRPLFSKNGTKIFEYRLSVPSAAGNSRSMWSAAPSDLIRGRILTAAPHSRAFIRILAHFYPAIF